VKTIPDSDVVEKQTREIGRYFWNQLERTSPSVFERRWWDDRILAWAMADESVKVQMFRFIDVLPTLRTREAITRHLQEYFEEVSAHLPRAARLALEVSHPNSVLGRALAMTARRNALRMAQRFIAGTEVDEVLLTVGKLRKQGFAFTLDLLGEAIISEDEADAYLNAYLKLMTGLTPIVNEWPEHFQIDCDHAGPIPRVNLSLKLSALYSQFNPVDPAGTGAAVKGRLRQLLRAARENEAYVHIDMEHYAFKDLTLAIFKDILLEKEFRDFADVGIVVQAYLPDAEKDLADLATWAKDRGTPIWVRLVKGAYWDYETVVARAKNWPIPVYQRKWQSDDNYERQTRFLMENHRWLRPAFGSHNLRSLAHAVAWARQLKVPQGAYEIQMLYGMGAEQAQLFAEQGHRVRIYTPFGELIPGMAYLVRRLLENTSNDSFLRASFAEHVSVEELLMKPADRAATQPPPIDDPPDVFRNEPPADFSLATDRKAMQQAVDDIAGELGGEYPLVIGGKRSDTKQTIVSRNPSRKRQIVGTTASASVDHAVDAIRAARNAFREWSRTEPQFRAEYIELVGAKLRERRFELAAWEVYECGKPWAEADADVAEAIDFCNYYAQEMRRLAVPRQCDVPGEENSYFYRPRGVVVVIAPWNFPLAILTGMTVAAVVTGNTVVMKPAEQSPVIAAKLFEIIEEIGIPDGVVNYLPGVGEEIGLELVGNPDVDVIAFTGSQAVGLGINERAAHTEPVQESVKRVIAEMGGKNAIIVDDDANLDEAVLGVVQSAFGYAGQKCSACSRAIVLEAAYPDFVKRLVKATGSLSIGAAERPGTYVGPVIDEEAQQRILRHIEIGKEEATLALAADVGDSAKEGYFVGPHIFVDVPPDARIAQEEIFGPVLAVIKARDFDDALNIANGTKYALTGGVFSRSPANLRRARNEFQVGNLYLNRGITGASSNDNRSAGSRCLGSARKRGGPITCCSSCCRSTSLRIRFAEGLRRRKIRRSDQPGTCPLFFPQNRRRRHHRAGKRPACSQNAPSNRRLRRSRRIELGSGSGVVRQPAGPDGGMADLRPERSL
jgi:RHH-type proline utilization regulon transcriptional repressor/proline dehydrogenase/delta 1-pyrroline-5-carboxylate dehydrogenase